MFASAVYLRFFRSFNLPYPFVKVPLEDSVPTIVGANESGKSQLLSAIKHALSGKGIERGDFCRYSQFFATFRETKSPAPHLTVYAPSKTLFPWRSASPP